MKYARTSCAVPGIKRSICGIRRNIFICAAPPVAALSLVPRSFFNSSMGPLAGFSMSNLPIRVSFTTSAADIMQIIASQCSRRARKSSKMGKKWSSRNNMPATTISACAMSALQRAMASSLPAYSDAACMDSLSPGIALSNASCALFAELAKCVSIVTTTTRTGVAAATARSSAAEMRFCVIKCLNRYHRYALHLCIKLGIAARFSANKKWNFAQLFFGLWTP